MSMYNHFRKEEYPFIERALELFGQVEDRQMMRLTDFLDPRQLFILQSLSSKAQGVIVSAFGGYEGAERVRAILHPAYIIPEEADFRLRLFEIKGNQNFVKLEHRDLMGALLHIGLKREKFGDILMGEEECQVVLADEVVNFVLAQVTHIHRVPVSLSELPFHECKPPVKTGSEKTVTVPSPRLDAIVGEACRLSRAKALLPIRAGKCKVNFKVVDDPSQTIKEGDMISLAGFGRFEVKELTGPTRSSRMRAVLFIYT
ncbi:YlmH family RNA-binding protein [Brevibacillus daliensis]|uniref:YlmH family RNA-binding protein n=1 Tax=Brevibacillus daliensis TaxID=2892995 RepID=UPI001E361AF8|nr:YlmH/Sll1252 family protein [Brevibacillus daliensis]